MTTCRSNALKRLGVPDSTPSLFTVEGNRVLVMDGDAACYQVASKIKTLGTALRHFKMKILEAMFLTKCSTARVHVTPKGCLKAGRHKIIAVKPYQGNRLLSKKPPLLEALRDQVHTVSNNEITVLKHYDVEADDAVMMDAYEYADGCVVWSEDKDLRAVPCPYYELSTGRIDKITDGFGWIKMSETESGIKKLVGHGRKFFWAQMLMGDTADNIQGILSVNGKKCGLVHAYELLKDAKTENDAANIVVDLYRQIDQDIVAEGELLWLLRSIGDNFVHYATSDLALTKENMNFVLDCYGRPHYVGED